MALLAHTGAGAASGTVTTAPINTAGAGALVAFVSCYGSAASIPATPIIDGYGNTWTPRNQYDPGSGYVVQVFDCLSPIVGAGHTFSFNPGSGNLFGGIAVQAWSGSYTIYSQNQNTTGSSSTLQPGPVTPPSNGALIITGACFSGSNFVSIDQGFALSDEVYPNGTLGALGLCYLLQGVAATVNPTWTVQSTFIQAVIVAYVSNNPSNPLVVSSSDHAVFSISVPHAFTHTAGTFNHATFGITVTGGGASASFAASSKDVAQYDISVFSSGAAVFQAASLDHAAFTIVAETVAAETVLFGALDHAAFSVAILANATGTVLFGAKDHAAFTVGVAGVVINPVCPLNAAIINEPYSSNITATGGTPPYLYSLLGNGGDYNIVCLGDSLTVGYPVDPLGSYPTQLATMLGGIGVTNLGVDGATTAIVVASELPTALGLYNPAKKNILLVLMGINDAGTAVPLSTTESNFIVTVQEAKTAGFFVIVATVLPSNNTSGVYVPDYLSNVPPINAFIQANLMGADYIIDTASDLRFSDPGNGAFFQAAPDELHLTALGYLALAQDFSGAIGAGLPPGLFLNFLTGNISGTPTYPGIYDYEVQVVDANGSAGTTFCRITVPASESCRTVLNLWQHSAAPQVEITTARADDWDNCGTPGNKFFQGLKLDADTFSQSKNIQIRDADTGTLHILQPATANHAGRKTLPYSFITPFLAHSVRLEPQDIIPWRKFGVSYVWEPSPEFTYTWVTQSTSHGFSGFQHVQRVIFAYASTAVVTLTITAFDGTSPAPIVLPSTGGQYQKVVKILTFNKGLLYQYSAVSSAPFQIWQNDLEVVVGIWGRQSSYVNYPLIGGGRGDNATI